jgi:hypothetical protein
MDRSRAELSVWGGITHDDVAEMVSAIGDVFPATENDVLFVIEQTMELYCADDTVEEQEAASLVWWLRQHGLYYVLRLWPTLSSEGGVSFRFNDGTADIERHAQNWSFTEDEVLVRHMDVRTVVGEIIAMLTADPSASADAAWAVFKENIPDIPSPGVLYFLDNKETK